MPPWFQKFLMCFLVFVLAFGCGTPAKADKDAALKAVIRAWKRRQKETTSFRFEWTEKVFRPKEQLPFPPKEDARFQMKSGVLVSGSRMATFSEGPIWVQDRFVPKLYRTAFDGTISKSFHVEIPEAVHPIGNINSIHKDEHADTNYCIAILLAFRAFHPDMGRFEEDKMQVIDEKSYVRNTECIRIEQRKRTYVARCWVDPRRDYVIVRYAMVFDGFPDYHCDVEYKLDNKFGWVPDSWHDVLINTNFKPVRLSLDSVVQVTDFAINEPVDDREFQLEFPPTTEVKDWINDQRFVVLSDGSKRIATDAENQRGITYEELSHSAEENWSRKLFVAASIAGLGIALGLLLLWVRKRRRMMS